MASFGISSVEPAVCIFLYVSHVCDTTRYFRTLFLWSFRIFSMKLITSTHINIMDNGDRSNSHAEVSIIVFFFVFVMPVQ